MKRLGGGFRVTAWQGLLAVALFSLGLLIAAQVRAEAPAQEHTSLERPNLVRTIEDLQRGGRFIRISAAGLKESHVHDLTITKEAPNYHP